MENEIARLKEQDQQNQGEIDALRAQVSDQKQS